MPGEGALIGIDLGTTAVKVVANAASDGRELSEATKRYALSTPAPGHVEQDADEIYRATMESLRKVIDEIKLRAEQPLAIGFSAAMHGVLAVDERGEPLSPLINWMDRRSASIAEGWREDGTAADLYSRTGAPMHPMLPLCKLRWLSENDPELFKRASRFVGMKELFIHRWTGEWLVDHAIGTATGMLDTRARTWDPKALAAARIEPERLSEPVACSTQRKITRPQVASALGLDEKTTVVLASSDGALANLGSGATNGDLAALTLGTSGAIRIVSDAPVLDKACRTFCYIFDDAHWLVGGPTSSAGAVLEWLFALLLQDVPQEKRFSRAVELANQCKPGAEGLTMLPFLSGERAPYWRGDLRGALLNLDLAHEPKHIIRAAFEGVVFAIYTVQRVMKEMNIDPQALLLSGGLTHAAFVRQMIADVFECEARVSDHDEASAFGAAMFAGLATGVLHSLDEVRSQIKTSGVHRPNPEVAGAYHEAFARFSDRVQDELAKLGG
ncbi:MAG TPA: gluconokinase [Candidatus Acidoferrales bacterium]|nr:gluconokinase [Candidatus Acidoferrales bacterium]